MLLKPVEIVEYPRPSTFFNKNIISEMNNNEVVWSLEEGEAELVCYECGADFRTRCYFLRHRRAHRNAEMFGVPMTEDDWRGMCGNDSDTEEEDDAPEEDEKEEKKKVEQVVKNTKSEPGSK